MQGAVSGVAALLGQIVTALKFISTQASGSDAFAVTTNGARVHFGAGATDYASSDGTTVAFAGPTSSTSVTSTGKVQAGTQVQAGTYVEIGTLLYLDSSGGPRIILDATAPTITSGFGTTPAIISNGTIAMRITIGSGGTDSVGVLALPAAARGWNCFAQDLTNPNSFVTAQTASTTTSASFQNYSRTTGAPIAWTAGDVLSIIAIAY
jgi:hypothetical protein